MTVEFGPHPWLAPLTKGGNLPFRRLCVDFGARLTMSEMAYSRQLLRRSRSEHALLRKHESETCFGVQLATTNPTEAANAGKMAVDRGADFVDLNVGCPIHDVVRRGMGATLLRRLPALGRIVEAMVRELPVPVTVKIRSGWREGKEIAIEVGRMLEAAGVAAVVLHARTVEQRYSKAADWGLIAQLASELSIPVIGNGDILTHYEARRRRLSSGCAAVMLARGALIKPWLFQEIERDSSWEPTPEERVSVYRRLAGYMKEHFRDDDLGRERAMRFLPWHFGFFCRYRPLPEEEWGDRAAEHPLMQTRMVQAEDVSLLESVLRDPRDEVHERIAAILWESEADEEASERLTELGRDVEPAAGEPIAVQTSNG